jgi:hypothetical protein
MGKPCMPAEVEKTMDGEMSFLNFVNARYKTLLLMFAFSEDLVYSME